MFKLRSAPFQTQSIVKIKAGYKAYVKRWTGETDEQ